MAERIPSNESGQSHEDLHPYGEAPKNKPEIHNSYEEDSSSKKQENIKSIVQKIEQAAKSSKEIKLDQKPHEQTPVAHHSAESPYKDHSSAQTLRTVQKQLKGPERQFSKLIHNQKVELASDVTGATVARPSGLLLGGILSLLSSITVLIICRYYGYQYNYVIGLAAFGGGFLLGIVIEFLFKAFSKVRTN